MSASHQQSLLALLHRANQVAAERFADALGDGDMTVRQAQVLAAIDGSEGLSQTGIVNLTGIDRSTLAEIVKRLARRKLIERRRTKKDARAYAVKLTEAGRRELAAAKPALGSVDKKLLSAIPAQHRADLLAMLATIVAVGEETPSQDGRT